MESTIAQQPEQNDDVAPSPPAALPAERPKRTLKVVLTLQPRDDASYRALVAVGADGCDPILHTLDTQDLPAIVAAIPDLVAQAEAHWAMHPRYPTVPTPARATAKPTTPAKPAEPKQAHALADATQPSQSDPPPVLDVEPPVDSDAAGQLSLFG